MTDESGRTLQGNLEALKPATRNAIEGSSLPAVRLDAAGAQPAASILTADGRWVSVHTAEDPIAAYERLMGRFVNGHQPALLIAVGLGLGYLLDALERQGSSMKVLAIEPIPAMTRAMLARRDWRDWIHSGRLTLIVGPDYTGASDAWRVFKTGAPAPPTMVSPVIEREFGALAARATTVVKHIVEGVEANDEARKQFAGRYLLNTLTNLPVIAAEGDVASLFDRFRDVPAIVVAAGPSLDKNVADLKQLEGRSLVIAVDAAVRPLLAAGIQPHLVVAVDSSELNARHLRDLPDTRHMWLVGEGSIDPDVFAQFNGRTFVFKVSHHHPWPWLAEQHLNRGHLQTWGSVVTTAFDLACQAGCNPIVFAGADLAYTDGLQYCRNTVYEPQWRDFPTDHARAEVLKKYLEHKPHLTQRDVWGREVLTTPPFVQFRDWIVGRADAAPDRHVVNATGAGILYGGRIVQGDLARPAAPSIEGEDFDARASLAQAWRSSWAAGASSQRNLERVLGEQRDTLPTDEWLAFGDNTTSAQIAACLDSAASRLTGRAQKSTSASRQKAPNPGRCGMRIAAEELAAANLLDATLAEAIALHERTRRADPAPVVAAANAMIDALAAGRKLLIFGNGGSAADAQHVAAELVSRFQIDRAAMAAIALTTDTSILTSIGNDMAYERIFARQVEALGRQGDVALGISTSGNSPNVVAGLLAAHDRGLRTIALTGRDGGAVGHSAEIHVNVPSESTARIQEVHRTLLHVICDLVERAMAELAPATV